jgi:hypothetical protein
MAMEWRLSWVKMKGLESLKCEQMGRSRSLRMVAIRSREQ